VVSVHLWHRVVYHGSHTVFRCQQMPSDEKPRGTMHVKAMDFLRMLTLSSHSSGHRPCLRHTTKYNLLSKPERSERRKSSDDDEAQMITLLLFACHSIYNGTQQQMCFSAIDFRQTVAPIETSPRPWQRFTCPPRGGHSWQELEPQPSRGETARRLAERESYLAPKVPLNPNRRLPIPVIL